MKPAKANVIYLAETKFGTLAGILRVKIFLVHLEACNIVWFRKSTVEHYIQELVKAFLWKGLYLSSITAITVVKEWGFYVVSLTASENHKTESA